MTAIPLVFPTHGLRAGQTEALGGGLEGSASIIDLSGLLFRTLGGGIPKCSFRSRIDVQLGSLVVRPEGRPTNDRIGFRGPARGSHGHILQDVEPFDRHRQVRHGCADPSACLGELQLGIGGDLRIKAIDNSRIARAVGLLTGGIFRPRIDNRIARLHDSAIGVQIGSDAQRWLIQVHMVRLGLLGIPILDDLYLCRQVRGVVFASPRAHPVGGIQLVNIVIRGRGIFMEIGAGSPAT